MAALLLHLHQHNQNIPRRLLRDRNNPLDYFSDEAIISSYRLDRQTIFELCNDLNMELSRATMRNRALPVSLQVMIALRYYASGSYMSVIGDAHGVSKMAVSRAVKTLSFTLARQNQQYIRFPLDFQRQGQIKRGFFVIRRFPNVLGAVDGSLIPISTPTEDEHLYVCRKGFHALNIQGVCDADHLFLNIVAKWPGATHDAHIWNNCGMSAAFEAGTIAGGWLLGDSGYGLKPWLLTPKQNPQTHGDRRYNASHRSTRCVIERTFGIWKMRFRCLHKGLVLSPKKACNVILANSSAA
ncbi:putative nuclease HARBI1 [Pecten maximus]|uniref:putative nuclease HARBI1 n=1 Tax=Pecten maximus TaxID=6579 RepID=UPI001458B4D1|nr:putative nuclease HARBI1 [Pecten maximus]